MSDEVWETVYLGGEPVRIRAGRNSHLSGSRWGVTEDGHMIQSDSFPWQRRWFFVRHPNRQVRAENLEVELGHRLPALFAAWAEWQATGVKPPTPEGIDEGYMEVWGGRDLDRDVYCHD